MGWRQSRSCSFSGPNSPTTVGGVGFSVAGYEKPPEDFSSGGWSIDNRYPDQATRRAWMLPKAATVPALKVALVVK